MRAIAALDAHSIVHAGIERDIAAATGAAIEHTLAGDVTLVAAAVSAIREGAAATAPRPGVAEPRRLASGFPDLDDVARTLDATRAARAAQP